MNPRFWSGRRVFLTGHTGFKGGWLALWLQDLGADVAGFALNPPTRVNLFETARVGSDIVSHIGDIRHIEPLRRALNATEPEIVFHLAAQPLVRQSYKDPVDTYSTNVMGTVNLLEAVRATPSVRAVVVVTTDKCYDNPERGTAFTESDPIGGRDPYSSSKGCTELVTAAYRASFFRAGLERQVNVATVRAGNVIGGGDWAIDRLVPDILEGFSQGRPVRIRYPRAVRPWQHVLEPLRGYLMLVERLCADEGQAFARPWNFGPLYDDAIPVGELVQRVATLWGPGASWHVDAETHPHEATYLKLDASEAGSRLGWHPVLDLDQALSLTLQWVQAHSAAADMREFTLEQIRTYQAEATHP